MPVPLQEMAVSSAKVLGAAMASAMVSGSRKVMNFAMKVRIV
jgi:hypothetical protein